TIQQQIANLNAVYLQARNMGAVLPQRAGQALQHLQQMNFANRPSDYDCYQAASVLFCMVISSASQPWTHPNGGAQQERIHELWQEARGFRNEIANCLNGIQAGQNFINYIRDLPKNNAFNYCYISLARKYNCVYINDPQQNTSIPYDRSGLIAWIQSRGGALIDPVTREAFTLPYLTSIALFNVPEGQRTVFSKTTDNLSIRHPAY
ncbi:hypothetical protein, partial [Fangia hongkongensis]